MILRIDIQGRVTCLYDELFELAVLGTPVLTRASHVEPDAQGQWWADLHPMRGPQLGPFRWRSQALAAERCWLEAQLCAELSVG